MEFEKYKNIPEFKLVNFDITMDEFKFIYWWEWGHRQLARFIGLVWFVGFLLLWKMKQIPERWTLFFWYRVTWWFAGIFGMVDGIFWVRWTSSRCFFI